MCSPGAVTGGHAQGDSGRGERGGSSLHEPPARHPPSSPPWISIVDLQAAINRSLKEPMTTLSPLRRPSISTRSSPPSEHDIKRHVWTTPSKQGRFGMLRRGRVRSCVRPTLRGLRTAGPDAIRSLAPKQIYALEWRITLDGLFQAPGSTGSPSRHHRPYSPISCGNADGVPLASGCATWDCCRHAIGFSMHEQSPYDPRRFVSLCHRDEPCRPAFEQAFEPASLGCGFAS